MFKLELLYPVIFMTLTLLDFTASQLFTGTFGNLPPNSNNQFGNLGGSSSSGSSGSEEWEGSYLLRSGSYGHRFSCVDIPCNFTLCSNMDYRMMMVPNLLGHDSIQEAGHHAASWIPLLRVGCHPDTQIFLCSLFSPICMERPIYPCRSLCQVVQKGCEPRMLRYNYPWPSMLNCDKFPEDHDLCIRPGAANGNNAHENKNETADCPSCSQAHTCENIVDNYCRSDFVFRAKFKRITRDRNRLEFGKGRWFKPKGKNKSQLRNIENPSFEFELKDNCCVNKLRPNVPYIVMGTSKNDKHVINFIMPWNGKDKILKDAVKTFRTMDCSNPLPMNVMAGGGSSNSNSEVELGSTNSNSNSNYNNSSSTTTNNRNRTRINNPDSSSSNSNRANRRQRRKQRERNQRRKGRQQYGGGCRVISIGAGLNQ